MIGYDERKGYYNGNSGSYVVNFEPSEQVHCGLDLFRWDLSSDEEVSIIEENVTDSGKKLTRQQKKEVRQNKKINAAIKRKAKREQQLSNAAAAKSTGPSSINVFDVNLKVKATYLRLLETLKPANGPSDYKILQYHSISLYKSDLSHLLPEEWLCDNNISFIYELFANKFIKQNQFADQQIYLLFPSLVQLFLHIPFDGDTQILEGILPMKELSKLKLIFIPMNYIDDYQAADMEEANNGDHWFLCVLNLLNNKLYVYDSMSTDEDDDTLLKELCSRFQSTVAKGKLDIVKMNCQQQDNFDDCGIFLLMYTSVLLNRLLEIPKAVEEDGYEEEMQITLDLSKVKLEPALARLYIMNLILKLYNSS